MSCPKTLAVPAEMGQKPSRVWIRVDLPAPFGPSKPMVRPPKVTLSCFRISRRPKATVKPESSMTGWVAFMFGAGDGAGLSTIFRPSAEGHRQEAFLQGFDGGLGISKHQMHFTIERFIEVRAPARHLHD